MSKNDPLTVTIEDGRLVISVGIHTLASAAARSNWATSWDYKANDYLRTFAITDVDEFAKDVRNALVNSVQSEGPSRIEDALDRAMESAVDDGSLGLDDKEYQLPYGTFADTETWHNQ